MEIWERKVIENEDLGILCAQDMYIHLDFCGVYHCRVPLLERQFHLANRSLGVWKQNLPNPCAIVLTLPRHFLQTRLYDKLVEYGKPCPLYFQILFRKDNSRNLHRLSTVHAVFGKVIPSADGETGKIEEDPKGWDGNSDLQLISYFPIHILRMWGDSQNARLGVALTPTKETLEIFKKDYGEELPFYNTCLDHDQGVYFFKCLPGIAINLTRHTDAFLRDMDVDTQGYNVSRPKLNIAKRTFTTRVKFGAEPHQALRNGEEVVMQQTTTCTVTIVFGTFFVQCNFPFPIASSATLRVARTSGWIDLIVPLVTPSSRGYFTQYPFPIVATPPPSAKYYSFFLPYVNLHKLPKVNNTLDSASYLQSHSMSMFTNHELILRGKTFDLLTAIKNAIHAMLLPTTRVLRIKPSQPKEYPIVFFIGDKYIDYNSRSVIAEMYVLPITSASEYALQASLPAVQITATEEEMTFWRSAMPAFVERSRNWSHRASCELISGTSKHQYICSCGKGKVVIDLPDLKNWKEKFANQVTKIAISSFFAEPYVEPKRGISVIENGVASLNLNNDPITDDEVCIVGETDDILKCKVCSKVALKKCSKCMDVAYCSRECQVKDWKNHKRICQASTV
jgi:hypothetical protein